MTLGAKKYIASALTVLGFGWAYFFFLGCALENFPTVVIVYLWPLLGTVMAMVSFIWLRVLYIQEPPQPPAAFRLQLADLIALSILFACEMAVLKVVLPEEKFPVMGPLLAFFGVALAMGGMLGASLRAHFSSTPRYLYAFIVAVRTFGWTIVGALIPIFISIVVTSSYLKAFKLVFGAGPNSYTSEFMFRFLGAGIAAWIVGSLAAWKFKKRYPPPQA